MKLIVECGATKSQWSVLGGASFRTGGMNFSSGDAAYLDATLQEGISLTGPGIKEVYFYAAGLFPDTEPYRRVKARFTAAWPGAAVFLENDLLAAARAVCGHKAGVAVILGTGSNTCIYDGDRITRTIPSGGFILGDEGSASALGRQFVSDYIKGFVPEVMARYFTARFDLSYPSLVREVYHGASPAGFLGSFAPEILRFYTSVPYARDLVDGNFRAFIRRCLLPLGRPVPAAGVAGGRDILSAVGVVGGFGYAYRDILLSVGASEGVRFARFLASPSEELLAFHA